MRRNAKRRNRECLGFSLVELMIVIAIIMILLTAAVFAIQQALRNSRADTALSYAVNQIRRTRERAIDERRNYELDFVAPRTLVVRRGNYDAPTQTTTYAGPAAPADQYQTLLLPPDIQFALPAGPVAPPDGMVQNNAIDFTVTGGAGGGTSIFFHPDGSVVDNVGGVTSGVVSMSRVNDASSCRAVSVFGATGRVKGWRLQVNGASRKWSLQ